MIVVKKEIIIIIINMYTTFQVIQAFSKRQTKVIIDERYFQKKLQFLITCKLMEKQQQQQRQQKKVNVTNLMTN